MGESRDHTPTGKAHAGRPPVVPIELFFDLVFVFVLSQITHVIQDDLTARGLLRGLAYLLLLWSVWVAFAWVGNAHRADDLDDGGTPRRLILIVAMALLIALGLVLPEVPEGLALPAAVIYCALFLLYVTDYLLTARRDRDLRRAILRMTAIQAVLPAATLVLALASPAPWAPEVLLAALVIAYAAPWATRARDWQFSPEHADERFSLLMLIVLGESLLSIGYGAAEEPFGWQTVAAICLGVLIVASLWWQYFDIVAHQGAAYLEGIPNDRRVTMARIIYSYLHILLVVGVMLLSVGLHAASQSPGSPLPYPQSLMLPAGIALYLTTLALLRFIMRGRVLWPLPVAAALSLLVVPISQRAPALVAEAACTAVLVVLVASREAYKRRGVIQPIH